MAHLSNLSIGFIVGGSVIFVSMILGFIAWKIIDSKRHGKPVDANPGTGQSRVETGAVNYDVVNHHLNGRDSRATGSVYTEIHVVDVHDRTTANTSTFSRTDERRGIPTNDNTDDSGYCEGQLSVGCSEVYSRLHEVHSPVENVYNDFADEDSGQGSHWRMNSVSANSDDEDAHAYTLGTPTRKTSSNQTDQDDVETTPRRETLEEEDDENYYSCPIPRVDIIEVHRPVVYEPEVEIDKNLYLERDDTSNASRDSDEVSVQDTPF